jgi:hypothetical protein
MDKAYQPKALFDRYKYQVRNTYRRKLKRPLSRQRYSRKNIKKGLHILGKIIWKLGFHGDYRTEFWDFALFCLVRGKVEPIVRVGLVAHHLISFARDACAGKNNASHYSAKARVVEFDEAVTQ